MPQWVVLYDVRQEPAPIRNEIRGGIAGSLVCAVLLAMVWNRRERAPKLLMAAFLVAWAGFSAWNAFAVIRTHRDAQARLAAGKVEVTEGVVESLSPPAPEGGFESFRIGSRSFLVSDGETKDPGLAKTSVRGGPVRKGAQLRIASSGRAILRVEERKP